MERDVSQNDSSIARECVSEEPKKLSSSLVNVSFIICSHMEVLNIIFLLLQCKKKIGVKFGLVWIHKCYRMQNVSKAPCVGFLMLQAALRAVRQALFMGSGRGPLVTVRQLDAGKYPNSIFTISEYFETLQN